MSTLVQVSALEQRALSKVKRYILAYILFGQVFYQLCRTNIGFAQLTMGKDLGLNAEAFGFASGIFALSAFLAQVPAGLLLEKFRARRWLTFTMAAWGLVVVGQAFVSSGPQLMVLRFLLGLFEAGFNPGVFVLINVWFKGKDQGVASACVQMGLGLSAVIGSPFAGWILGKSFLGLAGWRSLFFIEGALTVVWTIIALRILQDNPAKASWLDRDEREFIVKYLGEYHAGKVTRGAVITTGFWDALKDMRVVTLLVAFSLSGWVTGTFLFFSPVLLKRVNAGVTNQTVGLLSMIPYALMAVATYFWARHADRTERHWHCVLPCLFCATGILLFPHAGTPLTATACLSIVQIGNGCFFANFWPACNLVVGKEAITKATAFLYAGNLLASFIAPVFFGWLLDKTSNTELGMATAAATMIITFVLMNIFFFSYKRQQRALSAS